MKDELSEPQPQPSIELAVQVEGIVHEGLPTPTGPHLLAAAGPILEALASAGVAMHAGSLLRITGSPAVLEVWPITHCTFSRAGMPN